MLMMSYSSRVMEGSRWTPIRALLILKSQINKLCGREISLNPRPRPPLTRLNDLGTLSVSPPPNQR